MHAEQSAAEIRSGRAREAYLPKVMRYMPKVDRNTNVLRRIDKSLFFSVVRTGELHLCCYCTVVHPLTDALTRVVGADPSLTFS